MVIEFKTFRLKDPPVTDELLKQRTGKANGAATTPSEWTGDGQHMADSWNFEHSTAEGRVNRGGIPDDSLGRFNLGGIPDDSQGRTSQGDGEGGSGGEGIPDDSQGRTARSENGDKGDGIPDDSTGEDGLRRLWNDLWRLGKPNHSTTSEKTGGRSHGEVMKGPERPSYLRTAQVKTKPAQPYLLSDVERLVKESPAFNQRLTVIRTATMALPSTARGEALLALLKDPLGPSGTVVEHIVTSPEFAKLAPIAQMKLVQVMSRLDEAGLLTLGCLIERTPERLTAARDFFGHTLLDNLAEQSTDFPHPQLRAVTTTAQLLGGVIQDVLSPEHIAQGTAPTCTVTSMQYELARDNPAEYARLMRHLTGPYGVATMRGGSFLGLGTDAATPKARAHRVLTEAVFQTSAMEFANGDDFFDPLAQHSVGADGQIVGRGLKPAQQRRLLEQLFGIEYSSIPFYEESEGARALVALGGFNAVDHPNRPVFFDIDQGPVNHTVSLERVRSGRVIYRDPYGETKSMSEAEFRKSAVGIHWPKVDAAQ
jgi:hypothetical protein